jgi:DNA polymerase-3 subunit beta
MKFSASSTDLQHALAKVGGVVPSKSTLPILENILFDLLNNTLTLTATDMDISLTATLQVKGTEDGRIAIPAKRLMDTVRSFPEKSEPVLAADTTTNKIRITTANGEFTLTGESAKEFPTPPQFKGTDDIVLDSSSLKKIIHRTSFAVSTDELRPAMMGVLLQPKAQDIRAVATDGHRLVKYVHKLSSTTGLKRDVIIPAKALNIIGKSIESGDNTLSVSETHLRVQFDRSILISRLIDETYPNYESVIPLDNQKSMTVSRQATVDSIRRVSLYASATTHQIKFSIKKGALTLSAQDVDFGGDAKETIPCEYADDDLEIGFNSTYVLDVLTHLDADQVEFKFSTPTRAGIVSPAGPASGEDVIMLVMPVRLNS